MKASNPHAQIILDPPFDKNGNGRQGYLFDLNDTLAGIFTRALVQKNPNLLNKIPEIKDIL